MRRAAIASTIAATSHSAPYPAPANTATPRSSPPSPLTFIRTLNPIFGTHLDALIKPQVIAHTNLRVMNPGFKTRRLSAPNHALLKDMHAHQSPHRKQRRDSGDGVKCHHIYPIGLSGDKRPRPHCHHCHHYACLCARCAFSPRLSLSTIALAPSLAVDLSSYAKQTRNNPHATRTASFAPSRTVYPASSMNQKLGSSAHHKSDA